MTKQSPPPRFIPTLNESVPAASAMGSDSIMAAGTEKTNFSPSMVDFDLRDLETAQAAKVQIEARLQRYQSAHFGATAPAQQNPPTQQPSKQADSQSQQQALAAAAMQARQQQIQLMQQQYARQQAAQAAFAAAARDAGGHARGQQVLRLPPEWQEQLQAMVSNSVRQQLQQQMPFLLLQWSRQIEEHLAVQVQTEILQLLQKWQEG